MLGEGSSREGIHHRRCSQRMDQSVLGEEFEGGSEVVNAGVISYLEVLNKVFDHPLSRNSLQPRTRERTFDQSTTSEVA